MEHPVEVLGLVVGEAGGVVLQLGVGRDQAVIHGHGVDEGLQGRARRAQSAGHVDPAPGPVAAGRADRGANGAVLNLHHNDGGGGVRPLRAGDCGDHRLQARLQVGVEGRDHAGLALRRVAGQFAGGVPGQGRERRATRQRLVLGLEGGGLGDGPRPDHLLQHASPSGLGGVGTAVRAARLRRLRQGDQQGLLAIGQAGGLMAEIAEAGRPRALQIAAIGRQGQVQRQDLALGQPRLQLHGADHLDQL